MASLADKLYYFFPLRGTIVRRDGNTALIDLGTLNGAKADDRFLVLKKGEVFHKKDEAGYIYSSDSILGEMTITHTDELVSEGILEEIGFFSRVNQGDILLSLPQDLEKTEEEEVSKDQQQTESVSYENLSKEILRIP